MERPWIHELSGLIAAANINGPNCELRLRFDSHTCGVNLANGDLSTGDSAVSEVAGSEAELEAIVKGETTLQAAYRSGLVNLSGDPEPFLRLAMVLDRGYKAQAVCS